MVVNTEHKKKFLELISSGIISDKLAINMLMSWVSDLEVREMMIYNGYIKCEPNDLDA